MEKKNQKPLLCWTGPCQLECASWFPNACTDVAKEMFPRRCGVVFSGKGWILFVCLFSGGKSIQKEESPSWM